MPGDYPNRPEDYDLPPVPGDYPNRPEDYDEPPVPGDYPNAPGDYDQPGTQPGDQEAPVPGDYPNSPGAYDLNPQPGDPYYDPEIDLQGPPDLRSPNEIRRDEGAENEQPLESTQGWDTAGWDPGLNDWTGNPLGPTDAEGNPLLSDVGGEQPTLVSGQEGFEPATEWSDIGQGADVTGTGEGEGIDYQLPGDYAGQFDPEAYGADVGDYYGQYDPSQYDYTAPEFEGEPEYAPVFEGEPEYAPEFEGEPLLPDVGAEGEYTPEGLDYGEGDYGDVSGTGDEGADLGAYDFSGEDFTQMDEGYDPGQYDEAGWEDYDTGFDESEIDWGEGDIGDYDYDANQYDDWDDWGGDVDWGEGDVGDWDTGDWDTGDYDFDESD